MIAIWPIIGDIVLAVLLYFIYSNAAGWGWLVLAAAENCTDVAAENCTLGIAVEGPRSPSVSF